MASGSPTSSPTRPASLPLPPAVPNFFIVGAARSGTTSLHHWLNKHPDVHMTWPDKEPGYFCDFWGISDPDEYAANFAGAQPGQQLGDASTHYLTCPASPRLIREANPEAKIVISLRNPVNRAFSLFAYMRSQGHEPIPSFEEALAREPERIAQMEGGDLIAYPWNYFYRQSGRYAAQLRRYFDCFPREQILILVFEELLHQPEKELARLTRFLDLSEGELEPHLPRDNASASIRSAQFQYWLHHRLRPFLQRMRIPAGGHIFRGLCRLNSTTLRPRRPSRKCLASLLDDFRDDIAETEAITGLDLSSWTSLPLTP